MKIQHPKGEVVWVSYRNSKAQTVFLLTSKPSQDFYFLYEVLESGELKRLGKSRSPPELEEKFCVRSRMTR